MENISTTNPCVKGMTPETCPHNPRLGCDCKANPPMTQKQLWDAWKAPDSLEDNVKLFFELVDKVEVSSNDVEFRPNRLEIASCRVWDAHKLRMVMPKMRELVGAKEPRELNVDADTSED